MTRRSHVSGSPAIIVAALALIAAVGGTALAGPVGNTAGTKAKQAIAKSKKALKKARKNREAISNIELTAGPQGQPGQTGPKGDPGDSPSVAEALTIPDNATQTVFNLAEGTIAVKCDGAPILEYANDSGEVAELWVDPGDGTAPLRFAVLDGIEVDINTTNPRHDEWAIVTDDNVAFVDIFAERTGTPDCAATLSVLEQER